MKLKLCLIAFFILSSSSYYSYPDRDARGSYTENFTHLQIKASLHTPSVSYKEGSDIPLEFKVYNHGKEVVRIFPSTKGLETFQFQIKDNEDRLIEEILPHDAKPWDPRFQKDLLQASRNHKENLASDTSKEIALHPGESFSYRVLLNEKYRLVPGRKYNITGYFYPNITESKKNLLLSGNESEGKNVFLRTDNSISFFYEKRREDRVLSGVSEPFGNSYGVSPEETVFLFLGAEMKKNWGNYFKWIEFSDFILAYDSFSGEYINASISERDSVVEEFKKYLISLPSGKLKSFKVVGVDNLNSSEARVRVFAERSEERIPTRYEYEYTLRKAINEPTSLWRIHGVVARVRK
jgi:hypothetical protein